MLDTQNYSLTKFLVSSLYKIGHTLGEVKCEGEQLRTELNLKYHKAFIIQKVVGYNSTTSFNAKHVNKFNASFLFPIVYNDLPKTDNKRSLRLTSGDNSVDRFIKINPLIEPAFSEWEVEVPKFEEGNPVAVGKEVVKKNNQDAIDKFREGREEEKKWIEKYLKSVPLSSIEPLETASTKTKPVYKYVQTDSVSVPVRTLDNRWLSATILVYSRAQKALTTGSARNGYLYYVVDSLPTEVRLAENISMKIELVGQLLNYSPVLVSKSKARYFSDKDLMYSDDLFQKTVNSHKARIQSFIDSGAVRDLVSNTKYSEFKTHLPEVLPVELVKVKSDHSNLRNLSVHAVSIATGIDQVDYLEKFETFYKEFCKKYPLMNACIDTLTWRGSTQSKKDTWDHFKLYMEKVDSLKPVVAQEG